MTAGTVAEEAAGIGLRRPHIRRILDERPALAWLEVHPENYFWVGGPEPRWLEQIRAHYPLSFHGVGLSLGSADPLDARHLAELKRLADRYQPALLSEHLSWSSIDGVYYNDLLPLPYSEEAARHVARRIEQAQEALRRRLLIENITAYLTPGEPFECEADFITEVARTSGCGILLDINNVYVNARNHRFSAEAYLDRIPAGLIEEFHLAGHDTDRFGGQELLIDTHDTRVADEVWRLYARAVRRCGPRPTLIEWDTDLPELEVLAAEARTAATIQKAGRADAA